MGLYLRKRFKIAPGLRVNLSGRGVGLSTGVKGARVSVGPRGLYTYGGKGMLRYQKSLSSSARKHGEAPDPGDATTIAIFFVSLLGFGFVGSLVVGVATALSENGAVFLLGLLIVLIGAITFASVITSKWLRKTAPERKRRVQVAGLVTELQDALQAMMQYKQPAKVREAGERALALIEELTPLWREEKEFLSQAREEIKSTLRGSLEEEILSYVEKTLEKAEDLKTTAAKLRRVDQALERIDSAGVEIGETEVLSTLRRQVSEFRHFAEYDGIIQKAQAAESNGKFPLAVKYYREGLEFLRSDEIEDSEQADTIRELGQKIADLVG